MKSGFAWIWVSWILPEQITRAMKNGIRCFLCYNGLCLNSGNGTDTGKMNGFNIRWFPCMYAWLAWGGGYSGLPGE